VSDDSGEAAGIGSLVALRASANGTVWRIGPGWAVLAGAIASGGLLLDGSVLLRLGGAMVLADLAWGAIWRMVSAHRSLPAQRAGRRMLPYTQADAPVARTVQWMHELSVSEDEGAGWQELAVAALLVAALSVMLCRTAAVISLLALCVIFAGAAFRRRWGEPIAVHALLSVTLPWMLGMSVVEYSGVDSLWGESSSAIAVAASFTVLAWAVLRARLRAEGGGVGVLFGNLCVLASAIWLQTPVAVAVLAALLLVPLLWSLRGGADSRQVTAGGPWWLAAMMLEAAAARGVGLW